MSLNRRSTRSRVRAAAPPSFPCLVSALLAFSLSFAATLQPAHAQAVAPVFDAARARLQDAETIRSLTDEGRELMQKDRIKLDGFQYCGQSVALAERGEFRESIQAASKALLIGQEQQNARLVASAKRDLAITYGYAGDFERAEQYAREALDGAQDLPAVAAPSLKTLGDVAMRKGQARTAV
ncbi:MAG: Tetratricopeptide domain protein, partial [Massilia sp.]|nr:Tetratricopeptide domain protein [Massilia sp.]